MKKSNKQKNAAVARKRERRNRRFAARANQNHRTPAKTGAADLANHLSEAFLKNADWRPPTIKMSEQERDNYHVRMMRLPYKVPLQRDNCFVAVNSKTYSDKNDPLEYQTGKQMLLWQEILDSIRPAGIDFVKSGGVIWDSIDLQPPKHLVESVVSVHDIDDATHRAVNAALFAAYNTSPVPANMETVGLALAAFIHAHPHFKNIADDGEFHQPFGEYTFWKLLKPYKF
ncbi:hypothetical protein [Afipia clevelandensis]|uniref:Uncharacterized protein n=1 Tax=Afipia clevelandensis ATCC 49720 TaxID=883079 RepID=K8P631_9BRAD|nr:hypothetical protein [Afipia clevelandensis]EKS33883.1 hypothetical protein HMPREF9696_03003 [Afipia clevelandensis ATCC 49720]